MLLCLLFLSIAYGQNKGGEQAYRRYESSCALCHGTDGTGGEFGPNISVRLPKLDDRALTALIHGGLPKRGMPAFPNIEGERLSDLISFLRTIKPRYSEDVKRKVTTTDGQILEGVVLNQSNKDLELQSADKAIHLLRRSGEAFRQVTSEKDWPTYNGNLSGNRLTDLTQITKSNVGRLAPKWIFTMPDVSDLETTPVVVQGVMYVTTVNECYAIDAGNGRTLWHFQRPKQNEMHSVHSNRGVAVAGDGLFMVTDDAHLLRLNRLTGTVEWDSEMADWRQNYFATSAPLVVDNLVISGTAGGEDGVRGFLAAYDQATGKQAWRFWTVPGRGEPGAETWENGPPKHGAAVSWFTGSYDPETETLYWQTGNPGPDYNGAQRPGDKLFSDCILALAPKTGKLKWHYQFTPHDVHDWDATEPAVLADGDWQGQPRKLLYMANRNGFFYVLDRTDGRLLMAKPFVKKLNWASEIGADGRPVLTDLKQEPGGGTKVCPSQDGATNWYSTSYLPSSGLYYLQTVEKCDIYSLSPAEWHAGEGFLGGSQRPVPGEIPQKVLRAIDVKTGSVAWELPQTGRAISWGGTLVTQTGVLFFAEDSGQFMAVDASTGKLLWSFDANQEWKASPMAYQFDGREYICIASGQTVTAFNLPD